MEDAEEMVEVLQDDGVLRLEQREEGVEDPLRFGKVALQWQGVDENGEDLFQRKSGGVLDDHARDGSSSVVLSVLLASAIGRGSEQRV